MRYEPMAIKLLLILTGGVLTGNGILELLSGSQTTGMISLAVIAMYFVLLLKIEGVKTKVEVLDTKFNDLSAHFGEVTHTALNKEK
jgi:hypothetical protein